MRMVRLSRDASKQDEARDLLAPVYRSAEPRPFFPHSSTMPGPELPTRKPTTSFARSTDGDRLLTVIIDQQICLMLHDGEKGAGLGCGAFPMGGSDVCDYSLHNVRSRPAKVGDKVTTREVGTGTRGFAASEHAMLPVCVLPATELSLHSFAQ